MVGGLRRAGDESSNSSSEFTSGPGGSSSAPSQASAGASTRRRTVRILASTQSRSTRSARKLKRIDGCLRGSGAVDMHAALALRAQLMRDHGHSGTLLPASRPASTGRLHREHGVRAVEAFARPEEGAHRRRRVAQNPFRAVM